MGRSTLSRPSRRNFLKLAGMATVGTALAACAAPTGTAPAADGGAPDSTKGDVTIVGIWSALWWV